MELVSVIVPVYNVEKYLSQCIKSILGQTYKNIEVILVNDGSLDESGKICDSFLELDSRIKVIHKENEGLGYARNTGLEYVSGEYVTFVDSDDYVDDNMIEELINGLKKNGADTCIGGFKRINDEGKIKFEEHYIEKFYSGEKECEEVLSRMYGSAPDKHDAIRMSVWNVLYSMNIIRENNLRFPSERVYISEDIIWDTDYYKYARGVQVIDAVTYNYRIVEGSLTQKYKKDRFQMISILYLELEGKINAKKTNAEAITRLQRQFFVNLRTCISQERKLVSNKTKRESVKSIAEICNDDLVKRILMHYPINKLGFKQRLFLYFVQKSKSSLLYILANRNIV